MNMMREIYDGESDNEWIMSECDGWMDRQVGKRDSVNNGEGRGKESFGKQGEMWVLRE